MARRFLAFVVVLGTVLGCQDESATTAPAAEEVAPMDLKAVRDLLSDPLVGELVTALSDQAIAHTLQDLADILATPINPSQLDQIHWTFDQVLDALTPQGPDDQDEIERAVLGLMVEEAKAVFASLENEKGS